MPSKKSTDFNSAEKREMLNQFFDEESDDRTVAILGGSILEDLLEEALRRKFHRDAEVVDWLFRPESPLGSFRAKIDLSLAIGLVSKIAHADLIRIKDIRNRFAHEMLMHDGSGRRVVVTFDVQQLKAWCNNLSLLIGKPGPITPARAKFISACARIAVALSRYRRANKYGGKVIKQPAI